MPKQFDNEDDFIEYSPECFCAISKFIENTNDKYPWKFIAAYITKEDPETYHVYFSSYITPEYRNFELVIRAICNGNEFECSILKRITDLA